MKNYEYEKEGVYYTPTSSSRQTQTSGQFNGQFNKQKVQRLKPQKSQLTFFYMTTIILSLVVCILTFAIVAFAINSRGAKTYANLPEEPANEFDQNQTSNSLEGLLGQHEVSEITGLIQQVSTNTNQVKIMDVETGKQYNLIVEEQTMLSDKYGKPIVFPELTSGNIAVFKFEAKTGKLISLVISANAWEFKSVKNVKVDSEKETITYGNDTYKYDTSLITQYEDKMFDVSAIKPIDVLTIRGYKEKVFYVELLKSHGTLSIINKEKVEGGSIEIDTNIFKPIEAQNEFELLEGLHKVVVKTAYTEVFVKEVDIMHGETQIIDLNEVVLKKGTLVVSVNVPDCNFFINDNASENPTYLDYGKYTLKVEKEGFITYEQAFTLNTSTKNINVTLEQLPIATEEPIFPEQQGIEGDGVNNGGSGSEKPKEKVKNGKLIITSEPKGADIYIDGTKVGQAPTQTTIEYGMHTITVSLEGYIEISTEIEINDREHKYLFELQPIHETVTQPQILGSENSENSVTEPNTQIEIEPEIEPKETEQPQETIY